tara:strand:+ start:1570 stop:2592 length:1023 start_codon:yes stop_codon:yes gene_type:complete
MSQEKSHKFICEKCCYKTDNKSDYNKHILTLKHKNTTKYNKKVANVANVANGMINDATNIEINEINKTNEVNKANNKSNINNIKQFICNCGKAYPFRASLYNHKKKCAFIKTETESNESKEENSLIIKNEQQNNNNELKNLVCKLITENNEIKNTILKENKELRETINELIPKVGNNNKTLNQKFNIQVFLNEKCKDAINMTDFVKSIEVSLQQLDFTKQNGLASGLSKTIMDNMNKLSVYERPLHCTDVKRETLYIKDENEWSKDANKEKIKKAIKKASGKNYNALQDWKVTNPDFLVNDSKTAYFTKTITTIGKSTENISEKIIKNLCKETYVKDIVE